MKLVADLDANTFRIINAKLSGSDIDTGTLNDARLSSNVPLKNAANTFTANQTISNAFEAQLNLVCTGGRSVRLLSNSTPNVGIYDYGASRWLLRIASDDSINAASYYDTKGDVRGIPTVTRNSTAAFGAADAGKAIVKNNTTAYTWAVNTGVWTAGMAVTVLNDGSAGNVTISQGAGMTLAHGTSTGNFTLEPGQSRTLLALSSTKVRVL